MLRGDAGLLERGDLRGATLNGTLLRYVPDDKRYPLPDAKNKKPRGELPMAKAS
jgi:hypothetical protein